MTTLQDQFNSLRNRIIVPELEHNWLPIPKEKIDVFEKFLLSLLENRNIPQPNIFPTEDGNIVAEWLDENINKWAVSIETNEPEPTILEYLLHAVHLDTNECIFECYINEEYVYTIHDDESFSVESPHDIITKLKLFWNSESCTNCITDVVS